MQMFPRQTAYVPESVSARVGYFGIELESGLRAEMAASDRAALYRFSFVNGTNTQNPVILMDATDLPGSTGSRELFVNPETGRMTAQGTFNPSFGQGNYHAYVCVDIKGAPMQDFGVFNSSVWLNHTATTEQPNYYATAQGVFVRLKDVSPSDEIFARVGLSWLSIERACQNAEREIKDWDFERLVKNSERAWEKKLAPIKLDSTGVDERHLRNFWSGVYRAFISPQDYTGENPLWNSTEPYYDSWYCKISPLFTSDTLADLLHLTLRHMGHVQRRPSVLHVGRYCFAIEDGSLVDRHLQEPWLASRRKSHPHFLPEDHTEPCRQCRMSFCKGLTQGGSNADVVLVDSYVKKLKGVNWDDAYAAIIKDAEEQPPNWDIEGRGGLESWKNLGYIPYHDDDKGGMRTRSVSRTAEVSTT